MTASAGVDVPKGPHVDSIRSQFKGDESTIESVLQGAAVIDAINDRLSHPYFQVNITQNEQSTGGMGCASAADVRVDSLPAVAQPSLDQKMINEWQTLVYTVQVTGDDDPLYVMAHSRSNREIDINNGLRNALRQSGIRAGKIEQTSVEILESEFGLRSGEINPWSYLSVSDVRRGELSRIVHVFDSDLQRSYSGRSRATTNMNNHEWMAEFDPSMVVRAYQELMPASVITEHSIVAGGPSNTLATLDKYQSKKVGIVVNGDAEFDRVLRSHIKSSLAKITELTWHDISGSEPREFAVAVDGLYSMPRAGSVSHPGFDMSKKGNLYSRQAVFASIADTLEEMHKGRYTDLLVNCNILAGYFQAVYSAEDNIVKESVQGYLRLKDLSLDDVTSNLRYHSKADAISEFAQSEWGSVPALLVGGSQVTKGEFSIYRDIQSKSGQLWTLPKGGSEDVSLVDEAMFRVDDDRKAANFLLYQALLPTYAVRDSAPGPTFVANLIASTSLARMAHEQGDRLLDQETQTIEYIREQMGAGGVTVSSGLVASNIREINNRVNVDAGAIYAKHVAQNLVNGS